ncbi:hypothetical protein M2146_001050 [Lachnospiraceae bacterium PF1-22]
MGYQNNEDELYEYYIPDNYGSDMGNIGGFKIRNLIEAAIAVVIAAVLIWGSPFILKIRIYSIFTVALLLGAFFIAGIKDESVTQFIFNYLKYVLNRRVYRRERPSETALYEDKEEQSAMTKERTKQNAKEKLEKIKEVFYV